MGLFIVSYFIEWSQKQRLRPMKSRMVPLISFNRLISACLRQQTVPVRLVWVTLRLWDLSSEDWYDFDDSSSDDTEESSSDSKSNKETGMDIDAIQNGDFSSIAGTWKNGKGYTITFDKNGLVSDTERVNIENSKVTDGYLKSGTGPKSGVGVGGGAIAFLPKGVSLTGEVTSSPNEKVDDQSDKSKDRIWGGQSLYGTTDDSYFFYKVD